MGDLLSLTVAATVSDGSTPTYQWQQDGVDIPGATSATYSQASAVEDDAGTYIAKISATGAATVNSSPAVVTVDVAGVSSSAPARKK